LPDSKDLEAMVQEKLRDQKQDEESQQLKETESSSSKSQKKKSPWKNMDDPNRRHR